MNITRGRYGKLIRTWTMRFDSLNVDIKVFLNDGNSRGSNRETCFFAICEEYELKLRNTDIAKLETETRALLKLRVTTKWEPWISYDVHYSDRGESECGDTGEVSLSLSYQIIDRADIGLPTERFRKMDEHIGMDKKLVRNPESGWGNGPIACAPEMGYEMGRRSGERNPFHLNGVVRDTPATRMALQEVQSKLKQLYTKLAHNLEPEHAENFLLRVANTKLLLPSGEHGKLKEKSAKRRKRV